MHPQQQQQQWQQYGQAPYGQPTQPYASNPWVPPASGPAAAAQQQQFQQQPQYSPPPPQQQQPQQQQQPAFFVPTSVPQHPGPYGSQVAAGPGPGGFAGMDPFVSGLAGSMLQAQGRSYLARGQALLQSRMSFLNGSLLHYHFSVTPAYVRSKLLMLLAPFLRRWSYAREPEQLSGGYKYLPPRQDVNAPDLYIPLMAIWTYCILTGIAVYATGAKFTPELIASTVSSAAGAWLAHTLLLKGLLYALGIPGAAPFLELAAYAGYTFTAAAACLVAHLGLGRLGYHGAWAYASLCMAIFLVRTMKRVIFQEAGAAYAMDAQAGRANYLLLALAALQFPYLAWLAKLPA